MTTMMVVAMGGLGVLTVAWVAEISFRRASASLRHSIWLAALLALLMLPPLEIADIQVEVPVPGSFALPLPPLTMPGGGASQAEDPAASVPGIQDAHPSHGSASAGLIPGSAPGSGVAIAGPSGAGGASAGSGRAAGASAGSSRTVGARAGSAGTVGARAGGVGVGGVVAPRRAEVRAATVGRAVAGLDAGGVSRSFTGSDFVGAAGLFALWLAGALLLMASTIVSQLRAWFIANRDLGVPSLDAWTRLEAARREVGVSRDVRLVVSAQVAVPATWGFMRPVVVLPEEYLDWSEETLDRVFLHELAHIARGDCVWYLVGDLARAVHWFNPLAWLAVKNLRLESERACDDRVLDAVNGPSAYAADLVAMVRSVTRSGGVPRAALAMAQPGGITDRVGAILDPARSRSRVTAPAIVLIGTAALAMVLSATVVTPSASAAPAETAVTTVDQPVAAPRVTSFSAAGTVPATRSAPEAPTARASDGEGVAMARSVASMTTAAPALAAPQERLCIFRADGRRSTSHHQDDDEIRIRWETDDCRVDIDILGDVEFAADDRSVVALASDARFEIEERFGRDERRARLEGTAGGGMERRYWVDGDEVPWGPEADRWMASILPEIFRHTTINAEARVRRMVEEGGADRVFDEVRQIQSDHVSRTYLELLMEVTDLDESGYRRVIEAAADIDSDHGSAELLLAVVARAGLRPSFQDPLLTASEGLDSDHQRTRVLRVLLDSPLTADQLDAVLRSARSIESDHNLGELLTSIARAGRLDDAARTSFLEALQSIESDHQQAMVMHAFLESGGLSDTELAQVLALTDYLESDHQRSEILQRVARDFSLEGAQVSAYLRSAAGMESDHQKATTAQAITERADFDRDQMMLALRIAAEVDSDHQQATILGSIIRRRALDNAEMSELLRVARTIDSSHQLGTVVGLLLDEQDFGSATLVELFDVVGAIGSSHEKTEALLEVARRYDLTGSARDRYTQLAGTVGSRDRERLMAAISG